MAEATPWDAAAGFTFFHSVFFVVVVGTCGVVNVVVGEFLEIGE